VITSIGSPLASNGSLLPAGAEGQVRSVLYNTKKQLDGNREFFAKIQGPLADPANALLSSAHLALPE